MSITTKDFFCIGFSSFFYFTSIFFSLSIALPVFACDKRQLVQKPPLRPSEDQMYAISEWFAPGEYILSGCYTNDPHDPYRSVRGLSPIVRPIVTMPAPIYRGSLTYYGWFSYPTFLSNSETKLKNTRTTYFG